MGIEAKKTDNAYLVDKVRLRLDHLPRVKGTLRVLDCYGGTGLIWRGVARLSEKKIERVSIDLRKDIDSPHIHGDNRKIIAGLDLDEYDVVDLDAYGFPNQTLQHVLKVFRGTVFMTFISTSYGILPHAVLEDLGLTKTMIKKCPTLFARHSWEYFLEWLVLYGVSSVDHRSKFRKHYVHFDLSDVAAPAKGLRTHEEETVEDMFA